MQADLAPIAPDFSAPVDFDAELRALRPDTTTKGMFIQSLFDDAVKRGVTVPGAQKYTAFRDYPIGPFVYALRDVARLQYPGVPAREGVRRLGRSAYDTLLDSMIGKVLFGVLDRDIAAITNLSSKAYALSRGEAEVLHVDQRSSVIRLSNVVLTDSYQVGVFEGVIAACGLEGTVRVKRLGPASAEMHSSFWRR